MIVTWLYIGLAVLIALSANSISAIWASQDSKFTSLWFVALLLISPLVFITFGFVTSKIGLAMTSATVDVLLSAATILVGLFLFREGTNISPLQLLGIVFAFSGVILMQFHK